MPTRKTHMICSVTSVPRKNKQQIRLKTRKQKKRYSQMLPKEKAKTTRTYWSRKHQAKTRRRKGRQSNKKQQKNQRNSKIASKQRNKMINKKNSKPVN